MTKAEFTPDQQNRNGIPEGVAGGFFVYDAHGDEEICYADGNVVELFGCRSLEEFREYTGNSFKGMVHPDDLAHTERSIQAQTLNSGHRHDYVRYRILTKQGECRYIEDFGHLMRSADGRSYYYVFIVDVEKSEYENISHNSHAELQVFGDNDKVDRLTGHLNMEAFREAARGSLSGCTENVALSSVIVFDILGLREINSTRGHAEGDESICALSAVIQKEMPDSSMIFRGYEADLIVVCPGMGEKAVMENVKAVARSCKNSILFGIGTTSPEVIPADPNEPPLLLALEEAQLDLRIKKMLNTKSNRSQALTTLVAALEEVDGDTEEHVRRTQKIGIALGRRIGLSDAQLTMLQLLCLLHDIGKIAVPLEILNKPGRLSKEEWDVMRSHVEKGYQVAVSTDELKPLANLILCHHERWDGKGYPNGLAKEEIPVLSRIISIVDAYDAMVNDRSYRKALPPEKAQQEIRDNAGTQFDPYLAGEFLKMLEDQPALSLGEKTGGAEVGVFTREIPEAVGSGSTKPVVFTKYMLDLDDVIIEADANFEALTGYSREEAVGRMTQYDLIPADEKSYYIEQVRLQFTKGDIAYLRHPLQRKDGRIIRVVCNGERYFDSSVRAFRSTILVFEVS